MRPYDLRRTAGLDFYQKSEYDVNATAMFLNHKDLSSVHCYIGILDKEREQEVIQAMT